MSNKSRYRLISIFRLLALTAGIVVILMAVISMIGRAFGIGVLHRLHEAWLRMTPVEAIGFLTCGGALCFLRLPPRKYKPGDKSGLMDRFPSSFLRPAARGSALVIIVVASLALAEYIFKWNPSLDSMQLRIMDMLKIAVLPELVKPQAAINFLLAGGALLLIDAQTRRGKMPSQYLALAVLFISLLASLSYAYGTSLSPYLGLGTGMTVSIAIAFLILSIGIICARPERGLMAIMTSETAGGHLARRLTVPAIVLPIALGWLKILGEGAGYYDPYFGVVLLVMVMVVLFLLLVRYSAASLHMLDTQRLYAEGALRKTYGDLEKRVEEQTAELVRANQDLWAEMVERERVEDELRRGQEELAHFFENAPIAAHKIGPDGTILWANQAELDLLGYTHEEYVGHHVAEFHLDQEVIDDLLVRLTSGQDLNELEARLRAKDDSVRYVAISSNVMWKDGKLAYTRCFTKDITEFKLAEAALQEILEQEHQQLRQLDMLYHSAPLGMALVDAQLHYLKANEAMAELVDLPLHQIIGRAVEEAVPEIAEVAGLHFQQVFLTGEPLLNIEIPKVAISRLGVERDWLADYYPLKDENGDVEAVNLIVMDITERNLILARLRASEEGFRAMADSAPVMIWMSNTDKLCYFFNQRWLDFTGRTLAQEMGSGWFGGIHPDDLERCLEAYRASFDLRKDFKIEYRLRHRDGQYRWILGQGVPHFGVDGTFAGYIGTGIDIHGRRQAEELLRKSEELNRRIVESSADCIEVLDLDGRLISMNDPGLRMMEIDDFDSQVGIDRFRFWEGEAQATAPRAFEIARGGGVGYFISVSRTSKGTIKWWDVIVSPILDQNGQPERLVLISRDITERRRVEEERVQILSREQAARTEAEEANRLKDEFLATVSHELRAPLNAILGWVKLLREGRLDQDETGRALETVERSARTQNRIISDLLDVSRIITGKLRLNVRPIEPAFVIEAAVEAVRPAAEAKAIRLEMVLDYGAGPVSGDSDRLEQIIWNLLSNAIKFTHKFGRVQVRLERVNSSIEVIVSDTGQGINTEFLPYVFDRFRQADSSSTRRQGGLGLGLAIVRHLTEMHGGSVRAESPGVGQGATFIVKLPLMIAHSQAMSAGRAHPAVDGSLDGLDCPPQLDGLHILVVDDDPDARDLIKTILTQCNAAVRTAGSTDEALDVFIQQKDWRPELLISDIEMPGADGYSLIRELRKLDAQQGGRVPAVALTAYTRVEDRLRSLSAGFQMHLGKPIEPTELLTIVASLTGRLDRHKRLDDNQEVNK